MLQFLVDVGDEAFTDTSLQYVAARLRKTPNLATMRDLLGAYLREQSTPAERPQPESAIQKSRRERAERDAFLRRDWDDPAGIMARIRTCNGELKYLRLLALVVGKYAPQHVGILPPHILESLANDPEVRLPVFDEIRARGLFKRRPAFLDDNAVEPATPPRPAYLTPEQIERAGGRKQQHATTHTPLSAAAAVDPDAAAGVEQDNTAAASYPFRSD